MFFAVITVIVIWQTLHDIAFYCRLQKKGETADMRFYVRSARKQIIIDTADRAWAEGVPWEEAFEISQKAMDASGVAKGKGKKKGVGKGKSQPARSWNHDSPGGWNPCW